MRYVSSITVKEALEIHKADEKLIYDIAAFIQKNIEDELLDPSAIAEYMNISKATLYRHLKEIINKTKPLANLYVLSDSIS